IARPGGLKMRSFSIARAVALAGALVARLAFFLPWVTYAQRSFSGAELAATLGPALAAVKGGGIKGLDLGLWAVAFAAALAAALVVVSWSRAADPGEARYRFWAAAAAITGLAFAVLFGAIYWAWLGPYLGIETVLVGVSAQFGQELLFGLWFVSGLLGGYIIRRPGAAFLSETLAAFAEVLLGAPAGPVLIVTGFMQALGPELTFAATGYRRWGWGTMAVAGAAAGIIALPWNWL